MASKNEDFQFVNIARGIAIILVVLGHTIIPQMRQMSLPAKYIYDFIYSFHMALFAMLSGFLFEQGLIRYENKGMAIFIKDKGLTLLLPYLSFSIISYIGINAAMLIPKLASILERSGYSPSTLLSAVFEILTYENHIDKHLWFIYSLFIVFLISYPFRRLTKKPIMIVIIFILYVLLHNSNCPVIIDLAIFLLIFFTFARHIHLLDKLTDNRIKTAIYGIILVSIFIFYSNSTITIFGLRYFIRLILQIAGSLFCIGIARLLTKTKIAEAFKFLSGYTYIIYLLHQPFITSGIGGILISMTTLPYYIICVITLIAGIGLPIIIYEYIIKRSSILKLILLGIVPRHSSEGV